MSCVSGPSMVTGVQVVPITYGSVSQDLHDALDLTSASRSLQCWNCCRPRRSRASGHRRRPPHVTPALCFRPRPAIRAAGRSRPAPCDNRSDAAGTGGLEDGLRDGSLGRRMKRLAALRSIPVYGRVYPQSAACDHLELVGAAFWDYVLPESDRRAGHFQRIGHRLSATEQCNNVLFAHSCGI